ncbi:MAG: pgl [Burkholderiales bacterium]|jgi:6-phosphogluconolactonase|nr:pgl [Burkholderiales bacterium]
MSNNFVSDNDQQIDLIVKYITTTICDLLKQQNQVTLAVSGGKSPIPLFEKLSIAKLPWEKITITLVDERVTDTNSADSNELLVRTHLLKNQAANAKFSGLVLAKSNLPEMLNNANSLVNQIDIAILGMGEDGHTASIFPECPEFKQAIDINAKPAYIETNPLSAKYTRIGLNLSALLKIRHLILAVIGITANVTKLKVLDDAIKGHNQDYPISYLLRKRPDVCIFSS